MLAGSGRGSTDRNMLRAELTLSETTRTLVLMNLTKLTEVPTVAAMMISVADLDVAISAAAEIVAFAVLVTALTAVTAVPLVAFNTRFWNMLSAAVVPCVTAMIFARVFDRVATAEPTVSRSKLSKKAAWALAEVVKLYELGVTVFDW